MKLRATLFINIEAEDFLRAAEIQQHLDKVSNQISALDGVKEVSLDMRERRELKRSRGGSKPKSPDPVKEYARAKKSGTTAKYKPSDAKSNAAAG